jgi:hypothetical protein
MAEKSLYVASQAWLRFHRKITCLPSSGFDGNVALTRAGADLQTSGANATYPNISL